MWRYVARIRAFFREKPECAEADIANLGLHLAMAFGKNWNVPIQSRLSKTYPELTENELNGYNLLCQSAMKFALDTLHSMTIHSDKEVSLNEFEAIYIEEYPWVSAKNVKGLFNQGMYYACKKPSA